ncbi:MAG: primosomal protein [Actinobacteria bacterium HGW-Actinobacteria-4]|nr:MAG: primosomal protein [Actinobacteria bacterium HGW-Actinobacteria-4]
MTHNSRDALRHLIDAFEEHLEAVASRRGPDDAAVDEAYEALAESFERYEIALDVEYGESLPIVIDDSEDFDGDGDDDILTDIDEELDPHADEDEDDLDDDLEVFDLNS